MLTAAPDVRVRVASAQSSSLGRSISARPSTPATIHPSHPGSGLPINGGRSRRGRSSRPPYAWSSRIVTSCGRPRYCSRAAPTIRARGIAREASVEPAGHAAEAIRSAPRRQQLSSSPRKAFLPQVVTPPPLPRYSYTMEFGLDDEQEMIVQTLSRFAERDLRGWAAEADRPGAPPEGLAAPGAELACFLDAVPAGDGGLLEGTYSHTTRALRGFELGRACAGLAALLETNVEPALAVRAWGTAAAQHALVASLDRKRA